MSAQVLQLTAAQQDFLRLFYGERDGEITYAPPDSEDPKTCLRSELVLASEGETWLASHIDGQRWSVVAEIIKGSTPFHTPSFVMTNDAEPSYDFAVWRLSEPADEELTPMLRLASGMDDADLKAACPMVGAGGWRMVCDGEPRVYALGELAVDRLTVNGKPSDALLIGNLDQAITLQKIEISAVAPQSKMETIKVKEWPRWAPTIEEFLARNAINRECSKKSHAGAFTGGLCIEKARNRQSIAHMDIMVFDDDSAPDPITVCRRLREHGLFGIVYPTYSNGKTKTDLPREEVAKWFEKPWSDVTIDDLKTYLRSEKGYQEAVLASATLVNDKEHTQAGLCFRVSHGRVTKLRVVLFLSKRFVIADEGSIDEASDKWRGGYFGVAKVLKFKVDPKCSHLNALFYIPSHAPDAKVEDQTIYIVGDGELLDLSKITPATRQEMEDMGKDPFALAGENAGGGEHRTFETPGIIDWWVENKDKFDATEFFRAYPDLWDERGSSGDGKGVTFKCPRDGHHSNPGDPEDHGFVVWGADDSRSGIAIIKCEHAHCEFLSPQGKHDLLPLLDAACVQAGITDINELDKYVPLIEDEKPKPAPEPEPDPDKPTPEPDADKKGNRAYKNFGEAKRAVGNMDPTDPEEASNVAINIGMSAKLKAAEIEHLKQAWCKRAGMGPKVFGDDVKRGKQLLAELDKELDEETRSQLQEVNDSYAVVQLDNKMRIANEPAGAGEMPTFMQKHDFQLKLAPYKVVILTPTGDMRVKPLADFWLEWEGRRIYDRVVFKPGLTKENPREYNIWKGLAVVPAPGDWSLLRGHLLDNVCLKDELHFHFLMMWLAQLLQQPGIKLGSSLVIRGKKGVGKSKVFDWLRKALGAHALKVNDAGDLLNNFNKHQQGLILMVCEEAFWAGDTRAAGKLKDLITSDEMLLTLKGVDSIRFANMMRMVMISNEGWVVPAGLEDERRFFVLHCGEERRNDTDFFGAIDEQMAGGGLAGMVHELLTYQPDPTMFPKGWNALRKPPETPWLAEQGRHTLGSSAAYRFAIALVDMAASDLSGRWSYALPSSNLPALEFDPAGSTDHLTSTLMPYMLDFLNMNRESSGSRRKAEMEFGEALPRVLGAQHVHKKHGNGYRFPPFEEMAAAKRRYMKEADPELEEGEGEGE